MPRFRNTGMPVSVYKPDGDQDSLAVGTGQIIDVPGDLAAEQPADAYQIGEGDEARLWPHSRWELVVDQSAAPPVSADSTSAPTTDPTPTGSTDTSTVPTDTNATGSPATAQSTGDSTVKEN